MTSKTSFLKTTALFTALIYVTGMVVFPLVPKAYALYWEDDTESNDPKEVKTRPNHFLLFDWVDDANKDSKKTEYRNMDNQDRGPSVNNGAKSLLVVTSGLVGLGLGLFIANRLSNSSNMTANMFIGGAVGLGAGILAGALIMPPDYEKNPRAQLDLKFRQAFLDDPVRLQVAKAFHPAPLSASISF